MKRLVALGLVLAFALCLAGAAGAKSAKLEYRFNKGELDKYKLSFDMKMSMPGMPAGAPSAMNFKMSMMMRQRVLDVLPDGSAKIRMWIGDMKMSIPGMPADQANAFPKEGVTIVATMGKDGKVLGIEGMEQMMQGMKLPPGFDPSQWMGQIGYQGAFPDRPIEVGESWKQSVPLPFAGGQMNVNSVLEAAAVPVGKDIASRIKQTYDGHIDLGEMMKGIAGAMGQAVSAGQDGDAARAMQSISGAIDISGAGVLNFSATRGKLLNSRGDVKATMTLNLPPEAVQSGAPPQMNMIMDMVFSMTSLD